MVVTAVTGGPGGNVPMAAAGPLEHHRGAGRALQAGAAARAPVFGFEVRGRDVTVLTHPRETGSGLQGRTERWFRDNAAVEPRPTDHPRKKQ